MRVVEETWSYLRACPHCHNWREKKDLFCASCWGQLLKKVYWEKAIEYEIETKTLFTWREDDELVGRLIYCLKGGGLEAACTRLVEWILMYVEKKELEGAVFVPAPPRANGQVDHAALLAKCFSKITGRPHLSSLERVNIKRQKQLNRSERQKNTLRLSGIESREINSKQSIIFIDDVVTTGATAQAAYLALGKPKNFRVWALAHRPRLAWRPPL